MLPSPCRSRHGGYSTYPKLSLRISRLRLDVLEHGPVDDTVCVVRQRAGLQADDVLALDRPQYGEIGWLDDELGEDLVGVLSAFRVLEVNLVALFQVLEIVESQVAVRPREPDAMSRDVDVGSPLPREPRIPQVDSGVVVEQRLVGAHTCRYRVVLDLLHLGNRELERLVLGGLERVAYLTLPLCLTLLLRDLPGLCLLRHLGRLLLALRCLPWRFLRLLTGGIFPSLVLPPLIGGLARGGASSQRHHRQGR